MKKLTLLLALISAQFIFAQYDSLYVNFSGDTVKIWDPAQLNCCSHYRADIEINDYIVTITQVDTARAVCRCMCHFDLCTSLFGLAQGNYQVNVFRIIPIIFGDSVLYIGSINFYNPGSNIYSHVLVKSSQGVCHSSADVEEENNIGFRLEQNYPNPFNPGTNFEFQISNSRLGGQAGLVSLKIYNTLGMEIETLVNEFRPAGEYTIKYNGINLSSGIYFYKLTVNNFSSIKKMMVIK